MYHKIIGHDENSKTFKSWLISSFFLFSGLWALPQTAQSGWHWASGQPPASSWDRGHGYLIHGLKHTRLMEKLKLHWTPPIPLTWFETSRSGSRMYFKWTFREGKKSDVPLTSQTGLLWCSRGHDAYHRFPIRGNRWCF